MGSTVGAGRVYMLGAGPGDPGLVTLRAAAVLAAADIVYHDQLVSPEVLALARAGCELVDIGHRAGLEPRDIPAIAKQMATAAQRGLVVVRLKGGDPFLFGRGGEEAEALLEEGAALEVVPGVSSALAGPAAAGIPVTHRGLAGSVLIVTGHGRCAEDGIDWKCLRADTVVVLMGNSHLSQLSEDMVAAGWQPLTPAAVVMAATTARQRQVVAPLSGIAKAAAVAVLDPPTHLVVGEVVSLATRLNGVVARAVSSPGVRP